MIDSTGQVRAHSGQGHFLGNLVAFILVFGLLLGSIAVLGFWELDVAWLPGLAFLALYGGSFLVTKQILGRSDTLDELDLHGEGSESHAPGAAAKAHAQT